MPPVQPPSGRQLCWKCGSEAHPCRCSAFQALESDTRVLAWEAGRKYQVTTAAAAMQQQPCSSHALPAATLMQQWQRAVIAML